MIKDLIRQKITRVLEQLGLSVEEWLIEHPGEMANGDYSSNVAMKLFAKLQGSQTPGSAAGATRPRGREVSFKNPRKLAEAIVNKLQTTTPEGGQANYRIPAVKKIEVAGPGFINFYLTDKWLVQEMGRVISQGDKFGRTDELAGKKVMVEYTDPNPFKEFHIGHLYSNIVGESLARLYEASGATVRRACYQGDVGLHVAKALYGLLQIQNSKFKIQNLEKKPLQERIKILGEAYARGATAYEEDKGAKQEIEVLNQKIYERDEEIEGLYQKGRSWSLDYFETIYERLGVNPNKKKGEKRFDFYYFEREAGKVGYKIVMEGLKKGVFKRSQGAVVFEGKGKLHTRVFINSLDLPTYEAKDLGLAPTKYKDFNYDQSIIVTGNEINEYFRVVLAALRRLNPKLAEKTLHIGHGMVRLSEGKMSSRTGKILRGEWLLDEAKKRVLEVMKSTKGQDLSLSVKEVGEVAEVVGMGAVRYALLKQNIGRDIAFDFGESISFEGNSGPYLQYTFARAQSVIKKSGEKPNNLALKLGESSDNEYISNEDERVILRLLYRMPEVVAESQKEFAPNKIGDYLFLIAQAFNGFYNLHSILGSKKSEVSSEQKKFRLMLTAAVAQVIENGLYLLGIEASSRM